MVVGRTWDHSKQPLQRETDSSLDDERLRTVVDPRVETRDPVSGRTSETGPSPDVWDTSSLIPRVFDGRGPTCRGRVSDTQEVGRGDLYETKKGRRLRIRSRLLTYPSGRGRNNTRNPESIIPGSHNRKVIGGSSIT